MTRLTNQEFADRTGCDFTTASKIRNGQRLPGGRLLFRTIFEFSLDAREAGAAYLRGRNEFAEFINRAVFNPPGDEAPESPQDHAPAENNHN